MNIIYNEIFNTFLTEFNLPDDLSFSIDLPMEVQKIILSPIVKNEHGITLKTFGQLHKASDKWENQSIIEDNENHFHVDCYIEPPESKKAFMLGVKILTILAKKLESEKIKGIRLWYSFQTPELGKAWMKQHNFEEDNNEYFISDRLSFFKRRQKEEIISTKGFESKYWAIMIIDI